MRVKPNDRRDGSRTVKEFPAACKRWVHAALSPAVARRSTKVSLLVGTLLVSINHGDLLLSGNVSSALFWKIPMTFCVPYAVSTYAAVDALRASGGDATGKVSENL